MDSPDRLVYPAQSRRFESEALLAAAVGVLGCAFIVAAGIYAIVYGIAHGSAREAVFGVLLVAAFGIPGWIGLSIATRLEFADGQLTWRRALPWYPPPRPGRVRFITWPATTRVWNVLIEFAGGRKVRVLQSAGLEGFVTRIRSVDPAITTARTGPARSHRPGPGQLEAAVACPLPAPTSIAR